MKSHPKNNYAYEIRFVDDKIVQVFDIAAKNKQEGNDLPIEYNQEEVLRGQLRYSKLLGSTPSSNNNKLGSLEDDGTPFEHQVTTKRSPNRRSIQRHTFFMMGGGDDNDCNSNTSYNNNNINNNYKNYKQPQDFIEDLKPTNTNDIVIKAKEEEEQDIVQSSSSPPSPTPSIRLTVPLPTPSIKLSPPSPVIIPTVISAPPPAIISTSITRDADIIKMSNNNSYQTNQVLPINKVNEEQQSIPLKSLNQPVVPTLIPKQQQQQYQYYTEDYTSMTMIDTDDCDSKKHIQRQESFISRKISEKNKLASSKRSCCIIS